MSKPSRSVLAGVVAAAFAASLAAAAPALAQQKLKIGFITTMSGPQGIIGKHMKDSVELALDHLGRKIGGPDVEIVYGDDQTKPDVGVQIANDMLKRDQVDIMAGIIWSSSGNIIQSNRGFMQSRVDTPNVQGVNTLRTLIRPWSKRC